MPKDEDALFSLRIPDLAKQDAGRAIMGHALVDQMLGTLILASLPKKLSDSGAKKLLSRTGPFRSLPAKVAFASALGLIGDETQKDLEGINAVRNAFAHPKGFFRFESPEVVAVFNEHWPETDDARTLFDARIERAAEAMRAKFDRMIYDNSVRG
jgi:hypothetical protein